MNFHFSIMNKLWDIVHEKLINIKGRHGILDMFMDVSQTLKMAICVVNLGTVLTLGPEGSEDLHELENSEKPSIMARNDKKIISSLNILTPCILTKNTNVSFYAVQIQFVLRSRKMLHGEFISLQVKAM